MQKPVDHRTRVPFEGKVKLSALGTEPASDERRDAKKRLPAVVERISDLQEALYAESARSLLCIFQGIDGCGKDSTIEKVFSGVNPAGVRVESFKTPSSTDLAHDFLWRHYQALPERGQIGVWNRSWYEEVLVVRVHPEYLAAAHIPGPDEDDELWEHRYESICDTERHLARNGTVILKFFLNMSKDEQKRRFIARLDEADKNWKFNPGDLKERARWEDYQEAFDDMLESTSRPWAPWYAVPADDKESARLIIAGIIADTLARMDPQYPAASGDIAAFRKLVDAS